MQILTGFSARPNGIERSKRISRAANVGISPELCTAQLQHLLEQTIPTQLTREGQASQVRVIGDVLRIKKT